MLQKKLELLAPAGSWEALEAAVNAGADAVYLGGKAFGARQYASNFDREELRRAVYFTHMHRVRLYITVNTLVDNAEMDELADYLVFLNEIGVDGIIVQDLGVIRLARRLVPGLPLHASTQMTITSSAGVDFAAGAGMERIVLARELNIEEIKAACTRGVEIEVFIHGALCVCYSGQCLMSSLIGGRSGNRGRCAQPCRLPYKLLDGRGQDMLAGADAGQYLLSPRDMNTLDVLPRLIEAGAVSFKIEGRMKRPEYVAVVVDIYRRAIDSYLAGHYHVPQRDLENIAQIFNRDFTAAYLTGRPGRRMMSDRRPNNRGVLAGRVLKLLRGNKAVLKLEKTLHTGDALEFWVSVGGRVGMTVDFIEKNGIAVDTAAAGEQATISVPAGVRLNDRVFRTMDSALTAYARTFFGEGAKRRIPVTALVTARMGAPLCLTLTDDEGNSGTARTAFAAEAARKQPLDEAAVRKQIGRLGTTEYCLRELIFEHEGDIMVPVSELNEVRRQAVAALDDARLRAFALPKRRSNSPADSGGQEAPTRRARQSILSVHVDTEEKCRAALEAGADRLIFGGDCFSRRILTAADYRNAAALARSAGREIAFATPRIVKEEQLSYFAGLFALWADIGPDCVYMANNGLWQLAADYPSLKLWADFSLNIYNSETVRFFREAGAVGASLSVELTLAQVSRLAATAPIPLECMVQGRLEMMVSEYCVGGSFLGSVSEGKCKFACRTPLFLGDRTGAQFPVVGDQYCKMHILNSRELSMAAHLRQLQEAGAASLRIDARAYTARETEQYTSLYKNILHGADAPGENLPATTRGHYFRGVV